MDLVYNYMPDVYSYQAARHTASYDYWPNENATKKDCYRGNKKPAKKTPACSGKSSRDNCPICQERQRRPLASYIRSKSREEKKLDASIEEAEEEEEEEGEREEPQGAAKTSEGTGAPARRDAAATPPQQQPQPCPE
ncbi:uncharacterized protein LOC134537456 [Bacillus rossius redtenbacheri]|uniref:uncharacterized protein LOC134537456 n=1 Tax=Bacillus rossius redtenbacheri TaxID=93214 RepID=UPI002FDE3534